MAAVGERGRPTEPEFHGLAPLATRLDRFAVRGRCADIPGHGVPVYRCTGAKASGRSGAPKGRGSVAPGVSRGMFVIAKPTTAPEKGAGGPSTQSMRKALSRFVGGMPVCRCISVSRTACQGRASVCNSSTTSQAPDIDKVSGSIFRRAARSVRRSALRAAYPELSEPSGWPSQSPDLSKENRDMPKIPLHLSHVW
mgnify:CR=1 FL=1